MAFNAATRESRGDGTPRGSDGGSSMSIKIGRSLLILCLWIWFADAGRGQDVAPNVGAACLRDSTEEFEQEVWDKVAGARCLQCHQRGGEAEASRLVLQDIRKLRGRDRDEAMLRNRKAFARLRGSRKEADPG